MPALRLFLAIDIPPHARETVVSIQNRFKTLDLNASWVRPGNIHLTLKFLGNTPSERVADISKSVSEAVESFPVFKVALGEAGVFPNFKKPHVLWIDLKDPYNQLKILQGKVDAKMEQLGFTRKKKKFNPHLTLARIKPSKGKVRGVFEDLKQKVESIPSIDAEFFQVSSVRLIRSELTTEGSVYTILGESPLGQNA